MAVAIIRVGLVLEGPHYEIKQDRCLHIRDGIIESIESASTCPAHSMGSTNIIAVPPASLAHTHSMDHAFPEFGTNRKLEELVTPPHGLKHQLLARLSFEEAVEHTLAYYTLAWRRGVGLILDYRERGGWGCLSAKKALARAPNGITAVILGRPGENWPLGCDGLGLNSPLDYPLEELRSLVSRHRPSSAHVAETREMREQGDLETALEAGLDFIVHGTYLSEEDLDMLEERGVGLALCVSSNLWHGSGLPPVRAVLEKLSRIGIGTDNAAWHPPDPWSEASIVFHIARLQESRSTRHARRILEALLGGGYILAGARPPLIGEGEPARLVLFDVSDTGILGALDKYSALVKRLGSSRIMARIDYGEMAWL